MKLGRPKQRFCKRNHDTKSTGRNKNRSCKICARINQLDHYYKSSKRREALRKYHKTKRFLKYQEIWRESAFGKESYKNYNWKKYGIKNRDNSYFTVKNYLKLYTYQKGKCRICNKKLGRYSKKSHVDHNHKTGFVRGILCVKCNNKVLPIVENDSNLIPLAKKYLNAGYLEQKK